MKFLVFIGLVALAAAAPQPRKLFHEHFDDFMSVINVEGGADIRHVFEHYLEFEEFHNTLDYLATQDFRNLIYELESLPEFKAVVDFLENDNIDIIFFLDRFNEMIEESRDRVRISSKQPRHELSGTNFHSFIIDAVSEFPKAKLAALFEEKKADDKEFRVAVENLSGDEFNQIFEALFKSEQFLSEISELRYHGIEIQDILLEIKAVFGQN